MMITRAFYKFTSRVFISYNKFLNKNCFSTYSSKNVTDLLGKAFSSQVQIKSIIQLSTLENLNMVQRIVIDNPSHKVPQSVILKQFLTDAYSKNDKEVLDRFTKDWAGLEFLNNLTAFKSRKFYGGSYEERFILMEDLGERHISLVDYLTVEDQVLAKRALERFMKCLGEFHAHTYKNTDHYTEILLRLNPDANNSKLQFKNIPLILKQIGIYYTSNIHEEVTNVIHSTLMPNPFLTFVHSDICPDNVFDNPKTNQMHIIDFEHAYIGNALLDGTCLRMNMPSCWCAKALPKELVQSLELIYRKELVKIIPSAINDYLYDKAYADSCAYWFLQAVASIPRVLSQDILIPSGNLPKESKWKSETNLLRPRIISAFENFIEVSKEHDHLTHLRYLSDNLLDIFKVQWHDTGPLDMYPVFMLDTRSEITVTGDHIISRQDDE